MLRGEATAFKRTRDRDAPGAEFLATDILGEIA